jgi:hypothetical protein
MAIDFSWYIEGQVVLAKISGISDGADLRKGQSVIGPWMDESKAEMVHIIFDCWEMKRIAFSVSQELNTLQYLRHQKMGAFVVVGLHPTQRAIANLMGGMITRMTRAKFSAAKDMETAIETIRKLDTTIPAVIPPLPQKPATESTRPTK